MLQIDMSASLRHDFGKGAARQMRRNGRTPAILYGPGREAQALTVDSIEFYKKMMQTQGQNVVVTLDIEGEEGKKKHHVMIKEIQQDPIQDTLLHADFIEISLQKEVELPVAIHYEGLARGVDMGGILNVIMDTVRLRGLPLDIPDYIPVDITGLELGGKGITCGELTIPAEVTLVDDDDAVCVNVIAPSSALLEEELEEEEEEAGEEGDVAAGEEAEATEG